jgi:ATP-dependent RNA helicase HelY
VILEQAREQGGAPRITVMTADRKLRRIGPRDFSLPPEPVGRVTLRGQSWRSPKARKDIARDLDRVAGKRPERQAQRSKVRGLVEAYESHPVHSCPDVSDHLKIAAKIDELETEVSKLRRQVRRRKGTVARTFDRVLTVLDELEYVDEEGWMLTEKGELLTRIYNESDLLVAESLSRGWFAGLDPAELASVASVFVYQSRREEAEDPPTPKLAQHARRIADLYISLHRTEREHEIELLKEPDAGFMAQLYEWASGHKLEDILEDRETSAGDFVRSTKQVIDLLQQLRHIADDDTLADTVSAAIELVQRGVVAYSSVV